MIFSNEWILESSVGQISQIIKILNCHGQFQNSTYIIMFMKNSGLYLLSGKSNIENNVNTLYGQCGHTRRHCQWSYRYDIYLQLFKNLYCRFCPVSQNEWPIKLHSCLFKLQRWQLTFLSVLWLFTGMK